MIHLMWIQKRDKGLHATTSDHLRKSEDQWTANLLIVVLCGVALNQLAALWECGNWGNGGMGMCERWYCTYKAHNCQSLALCADCVLMMLIVIEGMGMAQQTR